MTPEEKFEVIILQFYFEDKELRELYRIQVKEYWLKPCVEKFMTARVLPELYDIFNQWIYE